MSNFKLAYLFENGRLGNAFFRYLAYLIYNIKYNINFSFDNFDNNIDYTFIKGFDQECIIN